MVVVLFWLQTCIKYLAKAKLTASEKEWLVWSQKIWFAGLAMALVTMFEWYFAYTVYYNVLVNEMVEALCEYVTVGLGLYAPYSLSRVVNARLSFEASDKPKNQSEV